MNNSCIFAERQINKEGDIGCQACNKYYCETEECSFYKSKEEYEFCNAYNGSSVITNAVRKKVMMCNRLKTQKLDSKVH